MYSILFYFVGAMSELFKVNRRVLVPSKDARGTIAFVGFTTFASGKWIGVVLDEPKGKNSGSVKGQQYFQVIPKIKTF